MKKRTLVLRSELSAFAAASAVQALRRVACVFLTLLATNLLSPQPTLAADWGACCDYGTDCYMSSEQGCVPPYYWFGPDTDCSMCGIGFCCEPDGSCYPASPGGCPGGWAPDCALCPQPQGACCNKDTGECYISEMQNCVWTWLGYGSSCVGCVPSVEVKRFEINQCFQEVEADGVVQKYDLIETKPFVVRVTLKATTPGAKSVNVRLRVENIGVKEPERPTNPITIDPCAVCDFFFIDKDTENMKAGNYKFSLLVGDSSAEIWSHDYTFKSAKTVRILVVKHLCNRVFDKDTGEHILWWCEDWDNYSELDSCFNFIEKVFPVPKRGRENVNHLDMKPYHWLVVDSNKINLGILIARMEKALNEYNAAEKNKKKPEPADFICAAVPNGILSDLPGGMKGRVILIRPSGGLRPGTKTTWGEIFGHEMGHIYVLGDEYVVSEKGNSGTWDIIKPWFNFDLNPPPLKRPTGKFKIVRPPYVGQRCDWPDKNPDSYGSYSNPILDKNDIWWCTGRFIGEGGYDVDESTPKNKRKLPPDTTFSMMSAAGGTHWISGPEYKSLIAKLVPTAPKSKAATLPATAAPLTSGQRMLISGIIDIPKRTAELSPLIPVPNLELSQEASDPNCQLVFKSSTGTVLSDFNFAPLEGEEPNSWLEGPFSVMVDLPTDTARIDVNICGVVADELLLTANSPTVTVISPNGGEQISGEMVITWSASDADINDTNDLSYTVEFSHDNGTEWTALAIDLDSNELTVDSNYLPGGPNCLVKIIASDGWNLAEDVSNSVFSITTKPPRITILDPEDGTILLSSESMQGRCTAYDPETGDVNDPNAIVWSSSIDGFLGKGDLIGFQLSVGEHLLSAVATDPEAKTGIDTVSVKVLANASDFNCDNHVDFFDLAKFAEKWQAACSAPNWCEGTDLDCSGVVDCNDLAELAEDWLWQAVP